MNPFSRMIGQAEVSFADLSRRTIESVTLPVKIKSQEVISEVTEAVTASIKTLAAKLGLAIFAVVMAIIALAYALSALHGYLSTVTGPIEATLIMAGGFAALAIVALAAVLFWPKTAKRSADALAAARREAEQSVAKVDRETRAATRKAVEAARIAEPMEDDGPVGLASGLGAIASALGEAGFRREQAGLRAGIALSEQLRPIQLVALALVGGFIAGIRMARRP